LLPLIARTFADLGYRRATTSEIARRCRVQENILYRMWKDKREMFLAAIDFIFHRSQGIWDDLLAEKGSHQSPAELLLKHESVHFGETGLYRIAFAALAQADDPEIRKALVRMYRSFHGFIREQILEHRKFRGAGKGPDPDLAAWSIIGIGTVMNLVQELNLTPARVRKQLLSSAGSCLLGGKEEEGD